MPDCGEICGNKATWRAESIPPDGYYFYFCDEHKSKAKNHRACDEASLEKMSDTQGINAVSFGHWLVNPPTKPNKFTRGWIIKKYKQFSEEQKKGGK